VYATYEGANAKGFPRNPKSARQFFDPALAKMWLAAKQIDADYFIEGQDWELGPLKVTEGPIQGTKANVTAEFTNFKKPYRLTYEMTQSADGWRIADVKSASGSFRDMLRKSR
jgi:hypothetical protein